jgi:hypothetical protein
MKKVNSNIKANVFFIFGWIVIYIKEFNYILDTNLNIIINFLIMIWAYCCLLFISKKKNKIKIKIIYYIISFILTLLLLFLLDFFNETTINGIKETLLFEYILFYIMLHMLYQILQNIF